MLKVFLCLLCLCCPLLLLSQGETSNWYFGNRAGIRFEADGSVTPLEDGQMNTVEGCATISDREGRLLFYTDGIRVYTRSHAVMQNGAGLYGDPSSTQSALIVPKPQDPFIYYIFTVDTAISQNDPDHGLNYSVVDLSLESGEGAVVQKNIPLLNDCSEKITAVIKNCSEQSIWLITLAPAPGAPGFLNTYYAFEISMEGVHSQPITTTFPDLQIDDPRGYLKFSSDGRKLVSANAASGLFLYDFDARTGIPSAAQRIDITGPDRNPYGLEFSPSGKFLYVIASNDLQANVGHHASLLQFDLEAPDISSTQQIIDSRDLYRGALQLGDNGKIYRTLAENYFSGSPYLGVIHSPDSEGEGAQYEHNGIALGTGLGTQGLPPFIQSFFDKTGLVLNADGSTTNSLELCEGEGFILESPLIPGAVYNWEKDGEILEGLSGHIHEVITAMGADAGRYRVRIQPPDPASCPIVGESFIEVLSLPDTPALRLLQCDADTDLPQDGITAVNLLQFNSEAGISYTFYESPQAREQDLPIASPEAYRNLTPFVHSLYYRALNDSGCESFGELELIVLPVEEASPEGKTAFACEETREAGQAIGVFDLQALRALYFPDSEVAFYRSSEEAGLELQALPGNYRTADREIFARLEQAGQCQGIERISLKVQPSPVFELKDSYVLCTEAEGLNLTAPPGFEAYRWLLSEAEGIRELGRGAEILIENPGIYLLEASLEYSGNGMVLACPASVEFEVKTSNIARIHEIEVRDLSENNSVEVSVVGEGEYEFSLDGTTYSESNYFEQVPPGFITVYVRDKRGCGLTEQRISVIGYPKYFSPNGDGINDSWQLAGVDGQWGAGTLIHIFDRYGQLMAQIRPADTGWNGTFGNNPLPAADYWFRVSLEDGREFNGHFSLKR